GLGAKECPVPQRRTTAIERHLRDSRLRSFGCVEDALRRSCPSKPRSNRVDCTITKRRRQQVVQLTALRRQRRLSRFDAAFEQFLLVDRIPSFRVEAWCC